MEENVEGGGDHRRSVGRERRPADEGSSGVLQHHRRDPDGVFDVRGRDVGGAGPGCSRGPRKRRVSGTIRRPGDHFVRGVGLLMYNV